MCYILGCSECGKLYKCPTKTTEGYITDFNELIKNKCLHCDRNTTFKIIETDDWIADLVFNVKGTII